MAQPNERPDYLADYFIYVFPEFNIANGAAQAQQLNIQSDSDFEVQQIMYHATIADAAFVYNTRPIPNVTAVMTDQGSGRNLMSAGAPLTAFAGVAEHPAWLPQFKTFQRNSTIQLTLTNFDAAVTYAILISLVGRKLFPL